VANSRSIHPIDFCRARATESVKNSTDDYAIFLGGDEEGKGIFASTNDFLRPQGSKETGCGFRRPGFTVTFASWLNGPGTTRALSGGVAFDEAHGT